MKDIYIKATSEDDAEDIHCLMGWITQCAMKYVTCKNAVIFTDEYENKDEWLAGLIEATETLLEYKGTKDTTEELQVDTTQEQGMMDDEPF